MVNELSWNYILLKLGYGWAILQHTENCGYDYLNKWKAITTPYPKLTSILGHGSVITSHRKAWFWLLIHTIISVFTSHRKAWFWLLIHTIISVFTSHRKAWFWLLIHTIISVFTSHRKTMVLMIHTILITYPCRNISSFVSQKTTVLITYTYHMSVSLCY